MCSWTSVAVAPGSMMLTRMPARVTSARSDSLNAVSANLLAAYGPKVAPTARRPAVEEMLTMSPPPLALSAGIAARAV